ncbi:MAG: hypothetical protein WAM60_16115 [Candidatus Promineifilaceae bacterium]
MRQNRFYALFGLFLAIVLAAFSVVSAFAQPGGLEGGTEYPLTAGWYQGQSTYYYSFDNAVPSSDGGATVDAAPIYVLFHENGNPVDGQFNIVDVVPGDTGYSDLWQVNKVTVPNDYMANTATSYQDLVDASYPITATSTFVNCPIVPDSSTLQYSQQGLTQGWHDGNAVYYFDFGLNPVDTAPIYVFFYGNDTPVPDQRNVIDTIPGESDYSAFWRVNKVTVPDDYVANSATSLSDIQTAGYTVTPTSILVNCPVVRTEEPAQVFNKTDGWYQDQSISYYSFSNPIPSSDGGASVTPAPIYVLFFGDGTPVPGQRNIVDDVPGDSDYSDLWQVNVVTVPDNYVANTIRSYAQIVDGSYTVTPMDIFVNCPVVPEDSTLSGGEMGLTAGWYRGQNVYYFDFGPNPVDTAPIYVLFYGDSTPVPGQDNIIDVMPGDPDYSAFWQVNAVTVPDDYVPNSVTSAAGLMTAGYPIQTTDILVNCPVVLPPTDVSLTGFSGESSGVPMTAGLILLSGMVFTAAFFTIRRRRSNGEPA